MTLAYSKPVEARDSQNDGAIVSGLTPTFRYCVLDSDGSDVSAFAFVAEIGSSGDYQVTYDLSHGDMSFGLDFGSPLIARDRYKSGQVGLVHSSVNAVNGNAIPVSGGLANLVPSVAYTPLTPVKANLTQVNGQAFSGYAAPACEYHTGGFTIQQPGTDALTAYGASKPGTAQTITAGQSVVASNMVDISGLATSTQVAAVPAGVAAMLLSVQLAEYVSGSSGPLRWTAAALALGPIGSGLTLAQLVTAGILVQISAGPPATYAFTSAVLDPPLTAHPVAKPSDVRLTVQATTVSGGAR